MERSLSDSCFLFPDSFSLLLTTVYSLVPTIPRSAIWNDLFAQ